MRGVKCGKYQFIALVGSVGVGLERFLFRLTQLPRRLVHTPIRPAAAGPFDQCDQLREEQQAMRPNLSRRSLQSLQ